MKFFSGILIILFAFIFFDNTDAQSKSYGAFGAVSFKYSSIANQNAVIAGGRFGWVINNSIVLGGGYYALLGTVSSNYKDHLNGGSPSFGFNYGGLELEYIFFEEKPIHFSLSMLFAGGGLYFNPPNANLSHENYFSQDLLVWEPALNIEANSLKWLHFDLSFSYRLISSLKDVYGVTKTDLKGLSAGITFKFGSY
jgi:hypothetical protein